MAKAKTPFSRRDFLKISGTALALGGAGFGPLEAVAAAGGEAPPAGKRDRAKLERLLERMEASGDRYWSVPRKDGEFLHLLVKISRAKEVLEVGTSHGFSAIWMGLALENTGGRLTTVEVDRERHDLARKHIAEAGLSSRITCLHGDAHREVTRLKGPFDLVFLDADKEGQVDYFRKLYPQKLIPGGILAVHNAIRQARAMKDYLDLVQGHPDFDTVILSATLDDGFCVSCRHRPPPQG